MDARELYIEGVRVMREEHNSEKARQLFTQSLKQDPDNAKVWLWLSATLADPKKQMHCVERALKIDPQNERALKLQAKLAARVDGQPAEPVTPVEKTAPPALKAPRQTLTKTADSKLTPQEEERIEKLSYEADRLLEKDDFEEAVAHWVAILRIQVDHEATIKKAVLNLWKRGHQEDAQILLQRAIEGGSTSPVVYLTAIDIAERESDWPGVERLRLELSRLPEANETLIANSVDYFLRYQQHWRAVEVLENALENHPENPHLLMQAGDLKRRLGMEDEALVYYDRAARLRTDRRVRRVADKRLLDYVPTLTDNERGSIWLAAREAAGVCLLFFMLAVQDAGLSLLDMGVLRWLGVLLSLPGAYLLVTATSSPQQKGIARLFGGEVPDMEEQELTQAMNQRAQIGPVQEPTELPMLGENTRYVIGVIGGVLLLIAFVLVFGDALELLVDPVQPDDVPTLDDFR